MDRRPTTWVSKTKREKSRNTLTNETDNSWFWFSINTKQAAEPIEFSIFWQNNRLTLNQLQQRDWKKNMQTYPNLHNPLRINVFQVCLAIGGNVYTCIWMHINTFISLSTFKAIKINLYDALISCNIGVQLPPPT